jgi:5'-methylthioadenosine phosphorylase
MVTDYDCWHPHHDNVDVAAVVRILGENAVRARAVLRAVATSFGPVRTPSPLDRALDNAFITAPDKRDAELVRKLDAVAGRALKV